MSAVRPEFGPTLPELLGPRVRALPRALRAGALVLVVALLGLALWALLLRDDGRRSVVVRSPVAFNFVYEAPAQRQAPHPGELARVGAGRQSFAVRALHLPAYRGDSAGFLPAFASALEDRMASQYPDFLWRYDGRANVNHLPGYEIGFQYRDGARTMYGRRILLLRDPTAREGADLLLLSPRSRKVRRPEAVGRNDALRTSLFSFVLGTEPV